MSVAGISSTTFSQPHISQAQASPALIYSRERGVDLRQLGQALQSGDLAGAQQAYATLTQLAQSAPWNTSAAASGNATASTSTSTTAASPFKYTQRAQDFAAIGQALQSGDLQGAQQAFAKLQQDLRGRAASSSSSTGAGQTNSNTIAEIIVNLNSAGSNLLAPAPASPVVPPASPTPSTVAPASTTDSGSTTPASTTAPADSTPAAANSSPEIILNLGSNSGTTPEIILNLSQGSSAGSTPELVINVDNGSSGSAPEITLNLNSSNSSTGTSGSTPEITLSLGNGGGSNGSVPEITLNLNGSNGSNGSGSSGFGLGFIFTPGPGGPATQSGGLVIDIQA